MVGAAMVIAMRDRSEPGGGFMTPMIWGFFAPYRMRRSAPRSVAAASEASQTSPGHDGDQDPDANTCRLQPGRRISER
jgi:hypothetical protein